MRVFIAARIIFVTTTIIGSPHFANATSLDGAGAVAPQEATGDRTGGVQEIVVTANKREQKLNDVGATVAVLSGSDLKSRQISSLADLAQSIPSLSFANSAFNTPVYTLRGVGFYETSLAAYPTVSVYVDEVPLPFPALTSHSAFDLERVEVLKGPQGTLFGQNATGGAINYIAAKPTNSLTAGGTLSYGRFNEVIGEAFVSGPLSSNLSVRLAGRIERADGWQLSNSRPGDKNGAVRNYMGRIQVAYEPTASARFLLSLNGWKDKSDTPAPQYTGIQPQNPVIGAPLASSSFSPETPRAADWTPGLPRANNRFWQASVRGDVDLTDSITLSSISSYVDYKQNQGDEADGLPISTLDSMFDTGRIKSFSQELRLSNGSRSGVRWVVGANYEDSKVDQEFGYNITDSTASTTLATLGYPISFPITYAYQKMQNYAFFGNVEVDLTDTLIAKAGIRYTNAKRDVTTCNYTNSGLPGDAGPFFFDVLLGGSFGPYVNGACFAINDVGRTIGAVPLGAPGAYVDELKEDNVSWKIGLDWKASPGILLYANVARGYKAGSFPTVAASTFTQYLPVTQESVLAYEAGFKASLLDRAVQLNGAAFYYDYNDKQLRSKINAPPFGILDVLRNVPKSDVKGFELELYARPVPGLTFNTTFTYIDAKIKEFTGFNTVGVLTVFDGSRVPFTPKYQLGANLDYDVPVGGNLNAFVGGDVSYRSNTVSVVGGDVNPPNASPQSKRLFEIDAYTLVNLRAGLRHPDDKFRIWVWGKNVFNTYYWNNVTAGDAISRYVGKPATYGVSLSYRY